jgi:hypothetical protein
MALVALMLLGGIGTEWAAGQTAGNTHPDMCSVEVLEGSVRAGESFVRPIGNGLEVMLEPLASGWILRVLPAAGPRGQHDYAELATPPYRSVSPLLISTDFSFRAQDAVAWNPRRFRFAMDASEFKVLLLAYQAYTLRTPSAPGDEAKLATLVSGAPGQGVLEILDAHFTPGLANQAKMASAVASHLETTPHTVEQAADGKGSPLGKVTWLRFRIRLESTENFRPALGVVLKRESCSIH